MNSLVEEKFGRSPFIIFYDTENHTFESLRNPYINIFGGVEIQTAQFIIEKNVAAVIAIELGANAFHFLKSAGIEVYYCSKEKVMEAVKKFVEGKLSAITRVSIKNIEVNRRGKRRRFRNGKF
jgi:predicted Fe-Mo cluster-binding NifX family protein